jgi:hypothetical protein
MNILVACAFTGVMRDALRRRRHYAVSCDLLPCETQGEHIQGDVRRQLAGGWDMMIAFPPCTYLCKSGVMWLYQRPDRWENMCQAGEFFRTLLDAPIEKIAIENPIPHRYALAAIGRKYDEIVEPWWFGDGETKATCFWLKNLPPLLATFISPGRVHRLAMLGESKGRASERSRTYLAMAEAMAEQWAGEKCGASNTALFSHL